MSVTIYVTSANYVCYESPKSGFFGAKNKLFHPVSNATQSQIIDNEPLNNTPKNKHFSHQVSTRLKKRPFFRG